VNKKKILITGVAGFIGFSLANKLLNNDYTIYGLDNINNYYDVKLKKKRISFLKEKFKNNFKFKLLDISDTKKINNFFSKHSFEKVFHFAAQAGVRYSLYHPEKYLNSNLVGFSNIIFNCKKRKIKHLIYASSSSVYGANKKIPYKEKHEVSLPMQYYAATKISNELIAQSYSSLYKLKCTGLRFFTVYGPWGRPDMSIYKFVDSIIKNKPIEVYNNGNHSRDFTYIDDTIKLTLGVANSNIYFDKNRYHRILNIGHGKPTPLKKFIKIIEIKTKKKFKIILKPKQKGDMIRTYACTNKLNKIIKLKNKTSLDTGISKFINWYKEYIFEKIY
tara:strand:- start:1522 stop:2517 length:996 start_codon:yes stop_codon:yes gene_type:complete